MKSSTFQMTLLAVFGFFAVVAIFAFAGLIPIFQKGDEVTGNVVMWGTMPAAALESVLDEIMREETGLKLSYVEKSAATFDDEFIEALAARRGPDLFFLPQDYILKYEDKVFAIPYESFSEREFKDSYVEEGELYLTPSGALGLPVVVDPMVMYWNRDLFATEGIANPPALWEEFLVLPSKLTKRDGAGNVRQSAVSLGEFANVHHAKDIIAMLMLQLGNPIVARDEAGRPASTLLDGAGAVQPGESSLRFFVGFSDPAKPTYSWNRSLAPSRQAFAAGKSAVYFGYASEFLDMRARNPHLNFDVARVPQVRGAKTRVNFGRVEALAITRASQNPRAAFYAAGLIASADRAAALAEKRHLSPARRGLLGATPKDPYLAIFYESALTARGWLDPSPAETDRIFEEMVGNITSGKYRVSEALTAARDELERLLEQP
ncbi:MAG: extracellular solute-binding protein [bacterium]|nr:extracellular solute-binding protein [bacterium]